MRLIVTAPTSAVGSNFIKYVENKMEIITVGRRNSDIIFDFLKNDNLVLPDKADSMIHFAGMLHAQDDSDILEMIGTNVLGTLKVCIAAKKNDVKQVILISSMSAVLGRNSAYYNFYSLSKKQAEETARLYCKENGIALCIVRPSQIFGNDWRFSKAQPLIYHMIKCAIKNDPIKIYGSHDALRNYIYADNLYEILVYAAEHCLEEDIDAIDKRNYSLKEVADIIVKAFHSDSKVYFLPDKADVPDNPFYTKDDFYAKQGIRFIGFEEAMRKIKDCC